MILQFTVHGTPKPQGSKNGYVRGGRVVMVEAVAGLKEWRNQITTVARQEATQQNWVMPDKDTPITITACFYLPKGTTVKRDYPTTKPDGDKTLRAVCDAITATKNIWHDDSQAVDMVTQKRYGEPRVEITIREGIL